MSETVPPRKARITASPLQASPDYWLPRIREVHGRFEASLKSSLDVAIELGRTITDAKSRCDRGQFLRLFSDHADPLPEALPFTRTWAFKLTKLASNPAITNVSYGKHLPPELGAIYELAVMKAADLSTAIEEGRVTPTMTRKDARDLRRQVEEAEPKEPDEPPKRVRAVPVRTQKDAFDEFTAAIDNIVGKSVREFPGIRPSIKAYLQSVANAIRT